MISAVLSALNDLKDDGYAKFSKKLTPDTAYPILGVRVPKIKTLAKKLVLNDAICSDFTSSCHEYFEEYFLHAFIIAYKYKDLDKLLIELDNFLPYVDNWAVCDSLAMALKIFKKYPEKIYNKVKIWLKSDKPYTVRFGLVVLLAYFLDENFNAEEYELVKKLSSKYYYVNMASAWFFSVALVKQYESAIILFEKKALSPFVHNKSIQKAIESFRCSPQRKSYLKTLKYKT